MAAAQTHPRRRRSSCTSPVKAAGQHPTLAPEAHVKAMLRDLAFVLHVTRQVKNELTTAASGSEANG